MTDTSWTETSATIKPTEKHLQIAIPTLVYSVLLGAIVTAVILAPVIAPYSPSTMDYDAIGAGPSHAHLLGTDALGRDILSRILHGGQVSLVGPLFVGILATILGTLIGMVSAWKGGITDIFITNVMNIVFAVPTILFAILAVAVLGPGLAGPVLALSVAFFPYIGRMVRASVSREMNLAYIDACRVLGMSSFAICFRHILPNIAQLILAQFLIMFASAFVSLSSISYLGLGVQPPTPEWGLMISEGQADMLNGQYWQVAAGAILIVITVYSVTMLGEQISRSMNTRR